MAFAVWPGERPVAKGLLYLKLLFALQLKEEKERVQREEEERRNRIELEQFQRKFDKRRNKDRRRPDETSAPPSRPIQLYVAVVAGLLVAIVMGFMWSRV